ncbi:MAG: HAD-IIB family hydrolase, partial [Ureaplasma sp.]|nr:HAD-IIB family hydrolase [Ureaplasma sp.]
LLNNEGQLTKRTIEGVKKIVNDGNIFCIATGRSLLGSIDIYKQLGLNSLLINHNGSFISNPSDSTFNPIDLVFSKCIAQKILDEEKVKKYINNAFLECKNYTFKLNGIHSDDLKQDLSKYYHIDLNDSSIINLENDPFKIHTDPYAMFLYLDKNNIKYFDTIIYHIKNVSPCLNVRMINLPLSGYIVEINTIFGDKSMGVNYLSSYYGIPKDRIITFGDGENDIHMLNNVKYGIAMKNAKDAAKVIARHITKYKNYEDGVVWDLEYFMKNKESIS